MENKQTQIFVRTAYDLERKWGLSSFPSTKKAVEQQKEQLNKTTNELEKYIIASTQQIDDLKNQIDGEVVTWFYDGTPTLENEPFINWEDYETKNNHIGDIYYDIQTGLVYCFSYDELEQTFNWVKLENNDVSTAMAVANADRDTDDHKRTIYTLQPKTPYEVGDVWIKDDGNLYRCKIARQEEDTYHDIDWILATDFSNDDVARNSIAQLSAYKTLVKIDNVTNTLLTIDSDAINLRVERVESKTSDIENELKEQYVSNAQLKVESDRISMEIDESITKYDTTLNQHLDDTYGTKEEYAQGNLPVGYLKIGTKYEFGPDGLKTTSIDGYTSSKLDDKGLDVRDNSNEQILYAGYDEKYSSSILKTQKMIINDKLRFENYTTEDGKQAVGCFWVGD